MSCAVFAPTMFFFLLGLVEDNFLVVADTDDKSLYQIDLSDGSSWKIPVTEMNYPVAVAYNHVDTRVYWIDVRDEIVKRSFLNGTGEEIISVLHTGDVVVLFSSYIVILTGYQCVSC